MCLNLFYLLCVLFVSGKGFILFYFIFCFFVCLGWVGAGWVGGF